MTRWMAILLLLLPGCTFKDGAGWADARATVTASLESTEITTDQGFEITITGLEMEVDGVALFSSDSSGTTESSEGGSFDPANPPPGFTLCHGGHCHAVDGSLVDYEDMEAIVAGEESGGGEIQSHILEGEETLDVLEGEELDTDEVILGQMTLSTVAPRIRTIRLQGTISLEEDLDLEIILDAENDLLLRSQDELPLTVGPDGPGDVELLIDVEIPSTFLDGVRFSNLDVQDGTITIDGQSGNEAAMELLLAKMAVLEAHLTIQ